MDNTTISSQTEPNNTYTESVNQLSELQANLQSKLDELRARRDSLDWTLRSLHETRLHKQTGLQTSDVRLNSLSNAKLEIEQHLEEENQRQNEEINHLDQEITNLDSLISVAQANNDYQNVSALENRKRLVNEQRNEVSNRWDRKKFEIDMMINHWNQQLDTAQQEKSTCENERNENDNALQQAESEMRYVEEEFHRFQEEYMATSIALFALTQVGTEEPQEPTSSGPTDPNWPTDATEPTGDTDVTLSSSNNV